jgi:hypothetical protein
MPTVLQAHKSTLHTYYSEAEEDFTQLINNPDLDSALKTNPSLIANFEDALSFALIDLFRNNNDCDRAHLFIQRVLYRINRLKLFWFDSLDNYANENSTALFSIRKRIETEWMEWELNHIETDLLDSLVYEEALNNRFSEDLNPLPNQDTLFLSEQISLTGYKRLLAITSLDGLVEASQLSRVLGGVGNEIQLMLTKIFWEEYGCGKLTRKHSSHFINMLVECNMETRPEAYFNLVPWEVLANINNSFLLSERKQNYLQYIGGLLYIEVSAPSSFHNYQKAGKRLGLNKAGTGYWDIHIQEDIRHGEWMLHEVAFPLANKFSDQAWQIVLGYDQQKFISTRAIKSIIKSIRELNQN